MIPDGTRKRLWLGVGIVMVAAFVAANAFAEAGGGTTFIRISAGSSHTCAVTSGGGAKCWGANTLFGYLGNGSFKGFFRTPVDVTALKSRVKAIAAGGSHSCALIGRGGVKCWGANADGAIGNGSGKIFFLTPADVAGLKSGVRAIAVGSSAHACAITSGGGVKCWGSNLNGQLGNGSSARRFPTPVDVAGLTSGVGAITAGSEFTCALNRQGGVRCWGDNYTGQLGNGSPIDRKTPVDVVGLTSGVKRIAAGGRHSCALTSAGGVKCWGSATHGQLGNGIWTGNVGGGTGPFPTPVDVVGLTSGVRAIATGALHTCAITSAGGVKCWGNNTDGQLGNGSTALSTSPVDVAGLTSGVVAITAGISHTCAITSAGKAKCWGSNQFGQLGNGSKKNSTKPVDVRLR